ncbi:MAG: hypothetical protein ACREHE_16345 [Rhizomicrobium sp.]
MINHDHLLEVAGELATQRGQGAPRQARLRRSISTSYYAAFHRLVAGATDLLIGQAERGSERYALVYRSFEHRHMLEACKKISPDASRGAEIRRCASLFKELQNARHDADYNPGKRIAMLDAQSALAKARQAIDAIAAAPDQDRRFFLTFLLAKSRSAP